MNGSEPIQPNRKRYIANDSTVEMLGELLAANTNGILVMRDELSGLFHCLDKTGQESAKAFYLEAWNGNGRFAYDRIGRGTVDIEAACLSIIGGIQPGPLSHILLDNIKRGAGDDGLLQRFQLMVWPDTPGKWVNIDRYPDIVAKQEAYSLIQGLTNIDASTIGAVLEEGQAIPTLGFSPDALEYFVDWRTELEHRLRNGEEAPTLESHLAKYRSLVPSLALLLHLASQNSQANSVGISFSAIQKACAWADYLESHARRIYGAAPRAEYDAARRLLKRIQKGDIPSPFTSRDVYSKHWSGLSTPEATDKILLVLEGLNLVRSAELRTGGRPTTIYEVNPMVMKVA